MISTTPTPVSQRAEPSPLWSGTFPKRHTGRGTTRISRVRCETAMRGSTSRVPLPARRNGAPHGRVAGGESDPLFFGAGAPRGRAKGDRGPDTLCLPLFGVALTTEVPGGKAIEPMRKPGRPHRPQVVRHAHENADSGSNNPKVVRVEKGAVEMALVPRRRRSVRPSHTTGRLWFSFDEPHSLSMLLLCQLFPEGRTAIRLPSRQSFS